MVRSENGSAYYSVEETNAIIAAMRFSEASVVSALRVTAQRNDGRLPRPDAALGHIPRVIAESNTPSQVTGV